MKRKGSYDFLKAHTFFPEMAKTFKIFRFGCQYSSRCLLKE